MSARQRIVLLVFVLAAVSVHAVTREDVEAGAARLYRERVEEARQRYQLDADTAFLERVQRIAARLIAQAAYESDVVEGLAWEIHTTTDPEENASCMAGGKLLIGQAYAQRLQLDDAELAMLIAHEMEHALQQHNLKEAREALRLEPQWDMRPYAELEYAIDHDEGLMRKLDAFDVEQEFEADREGMRLAVHAGWPAKELANYFKKLVHHDLMANADRREHPAPARRWRAAQALAAELNPS
ncbi:MAG TPA: M48 family metalloprotease [Burkholderiaceae bacterium]